MYIGSFRLLKENNSVCLCVLSHVRLFVTPRTISLPGSSIHGIFQARTLQVAISYSRRSSWPRDWTHVSCFSCIGRQVLYCYTICEAPEKIEPSITLKQCNIQNGHSSWMQRLRYLVSKTSHLPSVSLSCYLYKNEIIMITLASSLFTIVWNRKALTDY